MVKKILRQVNMDPSPKQIKKLAGGTQQAPRTTRSGRAGQAKRLKSQAGGTGGTPTPPVTPPSSPRSAGSRSTSIPKSKINRVAGAGYAQLNGSRVGEGLGFRGTTKAISSYGYNNFRDNIGGDFGDVAAWAGRTAAKGAFVGGAIGGTMEAAQGGSFWAGAKEGAFNGAVGFTAFRGAGKAFANDSMNPLKVAQGFGNSFGLVSSKPENMIRAATNATSGQRASMSKSVQNIIRNKQDADVAKSVMNNK